MKKVTLYPLFFVALLSICSCSKHDVRHEISEYVLSMNYKDDFRILQLSDTHIANKDDRKKQYNYLETLINAANADMIIVTGDLFTFADRTVAKEYFKFLDSFNLPWTVTFGNHDEQCYFSIDWLTKYLNNFGSHCLFKDIQDDDVMGNANFAINMMKDDSIFEQIIVMDSNRYCYGEYLGYDYIKQNQIDWYERLVNYTTEQNGGVVVPSSLWFHIPVPEFQIAYDLALEGSSEATLISDQDAIEESLREPVSCPKTNSGFFDKIVELGSTRLISVGHDHVNNYHVRYKGVDMVYGVTSTDRIYFEEGIIGGRITTIKADHSLVFEHLYLSYEEVNK